MRVPIRKPGKYTHAKPDPYLTQEKFNEFKKTLEELKKVARPKATLEVKRLAEMGDFSENHAYQMAKGRLRGINQKISEIENHLNHAEIITLNQKTKIIQIGSRVTIEVSGKQIIYQILGSSEADPAHGIISYSSPIGTALMGHSAGDKISIVLGDKSMECEVIGID